MRAENPFIKTHPRRLAAPPRRGSTGRTQAQPAGSCPPSPLLPPPLFALTTLGFGPASHRLCQGLTPKVKRDKCPRDRQVIPTIDERLGNAKMRAAGKGKRREGAERAGRGLAQPRRRLHVRIPCARSEEGCRSGGPTHTNHTTAFAGTSWQSPVSPAVSRR